MSVSGVSGYSAVNDVTALMRAKSASTAAASGTESGSDVERTDSAKISGPAEFMSKLQKLKETDPEKFKEVVQGVADKLKSAAESATDERSKTMLTSLADKFSSVADGGDLSQLEPPKPPSLSSSGRKAYGNGDSSDKMMGQMMGMQGPPPGPPPDASAESAESTDAVSGTDQSSSTDSRETIKSIFDDLNEELNQALGS